MAARHDILERAFGSAEWQRGATALFQATGQSVFVFDLMAPRTLYSAGRCGYCRLSLDTLEPGPAECFDTCPTRSDSGAYVPCRGGLTTYMAPVGSDGATLAHVVLSGSVSSTRERRKLYERLIGRGVREEAARQAVRAMPIATRGQVESYAALAVATAQSTIVAAGCAASSRLDGTTAAAGELRGEPRPSDDTVQTSARVADAVAAGSATPPMLLAEALELFGAEVGTIALKRLGGYVEVVASTGEGASALGTRLRLHGGAAARALENGRTVVVAGARGSGASRKAVVVAPLVCGTEPSGTLELRFEDGRSAGAEDVRRIERFACFAGLAIANSERSASRERALGDSRRAEQAAATLGRLADTSQICDAVLASLTESFTADVAGLVLTSWGRDWAEVALAGDATASEVELLLAEACGRDLAAHPLDAVNYRESGGALVEANAGRENWAFMSAALASGDHTLGFLFCAAADGTRYRAEDHRLLDAISRHAAAALERAALFGRIRDDFAKTVAALSSSLDSVEHASRGHSARVMEYAMLIGDELDLPLEEIEQLRFAGLLHDVGMTGVTEEILLKPVALTQDELQRVRMHAELGATVVEQIEFLKNLTPIVLHHHERWDGTGFPVGLAGEAIPLLARILAVADAFDLMTSGTQRQPRMTFSKARIELESRSGSHYDPMVCSALLRALDRQALAGASGIFAPAAAKGRQDLPA